MLESDPKSWPVYKDSKQRQEKLLKNWTISPASASNPYTRVKILGHSQVQFNQTQLDPAFSQILFWYELLQTTYGPQKLAKI